MKAWKVIVAFAENGVIGKGLNIPWHIPADFKHFKETTMGGIIVMGARTWESFKGRPLPGRENVVISKNCKPQEGIKIFASLEDFKEAYKNDERQIWICGGAKLYAAALPYCEEIIATIVKMKPEGDVYFPDISKTFIKNKVIFESEEFDILSFKKISR